MIPALILLSNIVLANDCDKQWAQTDSSPIKTQQCISHWLHIVYGEPPSTDLLYMDPRRDISGPETLLVSDLLKIKKHFTVLYDGDSAGEVGRVLEGIDYIIANRTLFQDVSPDGFTSSYEATFYKIREGRVISEADLIPPTSFSYNPTTLRILRNLVYARHGRKFQSKDLNLYFYGPDAHHRHRNQPFQIQSNYSDEQLTAADKHNIQLIIEAEKKYHQ